MKPILSLSTCCCSSRHSDGYEMLAEIAGLGFTHAELSHGISLILVPGAMRAVEEGVIAISSVHNFCPLPPGINRAAPNIFEPSSTDGRELDQWLRHTKRTIDFAAQVKAGVAVCHLGSVKFFWRDPSTRLWRYRHAHPDINPEEDKTHQVLLTKAMAKLRRRMTPYWEHTRHSLAGVLEYAAAKGVTLGLENREAFNELPLDGDWEEFLATMPPPAPIGYWHDTGHAQIKERVGLLRHREHLARLASRLAGFHLHDVSAEGRDHQPVGDGQVDFAMVSEFWRPEHRLVLELNPRVETEDIRRSKARVEELLERRFGGGATAGA